jgi:hypothetical protein
MESAHPPYGAPFRDPGSKRGPIGRSFYMKGQCVHATRGARRMKDFLR